MLRQDLCQVGHDSFVDVGGQVNEGSVRTVVEQLIVAEANTLERIGQLISRNADVHLLGKGIGHGFPVDVDTDVVHQLVQDFIVVITDGQRGHTAQNVKFHLRIIRLRGLLRLRRCGRRISRLCVCFFSAASAHAENHQHSQKQCKGLFPCFHNKYSFFIFVYLFGLHPVSTFYCASHKALLEILLHEGVDHQHRCGRHNDGGKFDHLCQLVQLRITA